MISGREVCSRCSTPLEPGKLLPNSTGANPPLPSPVYPTTAAELWCNYCGKLNK